VREARVDKRLGVAQPLGVPNLLRNALATTAVEDWKNVSNAQFSKWPIKKIALLRMLPNRRKSVNRSGILVTSNSLYNPNTLHKPTQ
jgi:hypothetical protein